MESLQGWQHSHHMVVDACFEYWGLLKAAIMAMQKKMPLLQFSVIPPPPSACKSLSQPRREGLSGWYCCSTPPCPPHRLECACVQTHKNNAGRAYRNTSSHRHGGMKKYKHAITKAFSSASPLSHPHDHRQKAELLNPPTLHAAADQPVFLSPTPLTLAVKAL